MVLFYKDMMGGYALRIRFGYVANAMNLSDCSPSKTVTATNLQKIENQEDRILKLRKIAKENINNTLRILAYNKALNIKLYRLTSKLVPLATHPLAGGWDYVSDLSEEFGRLGEYINENDFRASSHPDHFTLLNSPKEEVYHAALKDLDYHNKLFEAMGLGKSSKMVLHIGGLYKDKDISIARFVDNFGKLDDSIRARIILENDDKVYNAEDVLNICSILSVPMVLDVHHDRCNPSPNDIADYIEDIFNTWRGQGIPPKIHLSSPKGEKDFRSHADFIEKADFLSFLYKSKEVNMDYDIMIEAKQKDRALLRLMEDIKGTEGISFVNEAEIEF